MQDTTHYDTMTLHDFYEQGMISWLIFGARRYEDLRAWEILHPPSTMQWISAVSVWSDNLFLLSQPILLILPQDFALFCLSVLNFQFLAFVLFFSVSSRNAGFALLFQPTSFTSIFSWYTSPCPGVMSSCHAASLNWSFREDTYLFLNMHICLTCYSFTLVFIFLSRLISLLSVPSL